MRLRDPRLWLGLVSLALVLVLFAMDFEETSPGPLSPSHAALAKLQGQGGCEGCHGGWFTTLTESCLSCHEPIERQLAERSGLHGARIAGALGTVAVETCATCHVEHHGDALPLAGAEAFALAGLGAVSDFDHGHVAFALTGRHAQLGCAECHPKAEAALLAEGERRYLGLEQRCTACHKDPHEGRFALGCERCHGQERPFGELASFTHGEAFPLQGAHARPKCLDCHPKGGDHEVEDLAGHAAPPPARTCQDCHESPHRPAFLEGVARRLGLAAGDTCASCHDAERGPFSGGAEQMPPELHAESGLALARPHDRARCADCHGTSQSPPRVLTASLAVDALPPQASAAFAARFPGRSADACAACHADPHGGQFDVAPYRQVGCLACHEREAFAPHAFGAEEHARCAFTLDGRHVKVACNDCHRAPPPPAEGPRVFRGTPRACSACHADVHATALGGEFAAPLARREELGGCAACHAGERFAAVERPAFDHLRWTGFELGGAHARADCESCHRRSQAPAADGRTFGRVAQRFPGPAERCETCHADPHRGAFAKAGAAAGQAVGCERCHTTESFKAGEGIAAFDHRAWTGFALEGAHARARCETCHGAPPPPAQGPLPSARSFGFVRERLGREARSCGDCHADPHRGRFDDDASRAAGASCERCHSSESFGAIERAGFDHARWTGFELSGVHARAACEACHAPVEPPVAGQPRLGKALGTDCAACHADPHAGQFARQGRTDCAACHRETGSFRELEFDHQRDSRFPLDGRHAKLACGACHIPWPLKSGEKVVRYKPLGVECIDCHDPRAGREGGTRAGAGGGGLR